VESEAVLLIPERYGTPDDMIDRDVLAAQFKAVTVAVGGRAAARQGSIVVGDTILYGYGANGTGIALGVEVPAVINVVVSDAAAKDVARPRRQLAGESVGVLAVVRIIVVKGSAIEDQVVRRPVTLRSARRVTTELKS